MQMSTEINELATALTAAQAALRPAPKDATNPAYKSRYADLASIVETCRPVLAENGLAVCQLFEESDPGTLRLTTLLLHDSGQWISGTCAIPYGKADPQGYGSAATYGRRYGLSAILGMVADDDDDGNAACAVSAPRTEAQRANGGQQTPAPVSGAPSGDPIWHGPGQCPSCRAPEGRPHGTAIPGHRRCTHVDTTPQRILPPPPSRATGGNPEKNAP